MKTNWLNLLIVIAGCWIIGVIEMAIFRPAPAPMWTIIFYIMWGMVSVPLIGPIFEKAN